VRGAELQGVFMRVERQGVKGRCSEACEFLTKVETNKKKTKAAKTMRRIKREKQTNVTLKGIRRCIKAKGEERSRNN